MQYFDSMDNDDMDNLDYVDYDEDNIKEFDELIFMYENEDDEDDEFGRESGIEAVMRRVEDDMRQDARKIEKKRKRVKPRVNNFECPICLEELKQDECLTFCAEVCGNVFHQECTSRTDRCAMCRGAPASELGGNQKKEFFCRLVDE